MRCANELLYLVLRRVHSRTYSLKYVGDRRHWNRHLNALSSNFNMQDARYKNISLPTAKLSSNKGSKASQHNISTVSKEKRSRGYKHKMKLLKPKKSIQLFVVGYIEACY